MTQDAGAGLDTGTNDDEMERVHEAILAGRKIEAIKIYREVRGVGLKEAKEAVEHLIAEGPDAYGSERGTGHSAVESSSGCGAVLLVGLGGLLFMLLI